MQNAKNRSFITTEHYIIYKLPTQTEDKTE